MTERQRENAHSSTCAVLLGRRWEILHVINVQEATPSSEGANVQLSNSPLPLMDCRDWTSHETEISTLIEGLANWHNHGIDGLPSEHHSAWFAQLSLFRSLFVFLRSRVTQSCTHWTVI